MRDALGKLRCTGADRASAPRAPPPCGGRSSSVPAYAIARRYRHRQRAGAGPPWSLVPGPRLGRFSRRVRWTRSAVQLQVLGEVSHAPAPDPARCQEKGENRHRVEVRLEGDGAPWVAESRFAFDLTAQDEEDLRWYLEDFLQYPQEPAPTIARRVEGRIAEIGKELFRGVFQASDEARDLWAQVRDRLPQTRVEIVTGVAAAASLPWELLRDPRTDLAAGPHRPLVRPRAAQSAARAARLRNWSGRADADPAGALPARGRGRDVPFRSVASRLLKGLDEGNRAVYDLDVLRPPTFEQLGKALRRAQGGGPALPRGPLRRPRHSTASRRSCASWCGARRRLTADRHAPRRARTATWCSRTRSSRTTGSWWTAPRWAGCCTRPGCRCWCSTPAARRTPRPPETPERGGEDGDPHSQVRAFGSLAQEVMDGRAWPGWWPCATTSTWSPPPSSWPSCTPRWLGGRRWARR